MTDYERIINAHVATTTVFVVGRAVDHIAEELALEILRDPTWRTEMRALVRRAFDRTVRQLTTNGTRRPRRKRKRR